MIRIAYHRNFLKSVTRLPKAQQDKLAKLIALIKELFPPSLSFAKASESFGWTRRLSLLWIEPRWNHNV